MKRLHIYFLPQLVIEAYDSFYPENRVSANLTIVVTRNENKPRFGRSRYSSDVTDTAELGTVIKQLNATDADEVSKKGNISSRFSINFVCF